MSCETHKYTYHELSLILVLKDVTNNFGSWDIELFVCPFVFLPTNSFYNLEYDVLPFYKKKTKNNGFLKS
jgi:hypothetical protein